MLACVTWIMTGNAMPAPSCDMDCQRAHITIRHRLASPRLEINSISGKSLRMINLNSMYNCRKLVPCLYFCLIRFDGEMMESSYLVAIFLLS